MVAKDNKKLYQSREWLEFQYHGQKRTVSEMAQMAGCSRSNVGQWMKRHNISTRTAAERNKGSGNPRYKGLAARMFTCEGCGKECFAGRPSEKRRFCTHECASIHVVGANHPNWKGGPITRQCEVCGQDFETKPSEVAKGWGRFCSCKCAGMLHPIGEKAANWRGGKQEKQCITCGKTFFVFPSQAKNRKHCDIKCKAIGQQGPHPERRKRISLLCGQCGAKFETVPSLKEKRKLCSKDCRLAWRSAEMKQRHLDGAFPYDAEWREKHHAVTTTQEWADGAKARVVTRWADPDYVEKQSQRMKERWTRGDFDGVFKSPTSIELQTAAALDILDIAHISQYRPDGYSRVFDEFVLPDIVIEVNGDYWHSEERRPGMARRDAEKAQWAKDNGYETVVFWEREINERGAQALVVERVLPLLQGKGI